MIRPHLASVSFCDSYRVHFPSIVDCALRAPDKNYRSRLAHAFSSIHLNFITVQAKPENDLSARHATPQEDDACVWGDITFI